MAMEATFAAFDEAVEQDKPYASQELADAIEKLGASTPAAAPLLDARRKAVAKVRQDVKDLDHLLHELRTDDGWKKSYDKKGITVHFKKPEGTPFLMTKAARRIKPLEGKTLSYTFVALVSMFAEVELMPEYFPRGLMKSHETLEKPTKWSRYTRMRIAAPALVPISAREAVIKGKGYDITEQSAICIAFKSLPDDYESDDFEMPPVEKKYTRIDISGAYYFELMPDGSVLMMNVQLLDLKLPFVPPFVINLLAKGALPVEFFHNLDKTFRKFEGSDWERAVAEKPETYEDVRLRMEAYLKAHGIANEPGSIAHSNSSASTAADEEDSHEEDAGPAAHEHEHGYVHSVVHTVLSLVLSDEHAQDYADKAHGWVHGHPGAAAHDKPAQPRRSIAKRISQRMGLSHAAAEARPAKGKAKLVKGKRGFSLRKKKELAPGLVSEADL